MSWQTSGLHTIRLDVTDSDGATSNTNERWVNIRNVPPMVQPLDSFLPLAEGEPITIILVILQIQLVIFRRWSNVGM